MDTSPQPFPDCMRAVAAAGLAMFLREIRFHPQHEAALRQRIVDTANRLHDALPSEPDKMIGQTLVDALDWIDAQEPRP